MKAKDARNQYLLVPAPLFLVLVPFAAGIFMARGMSGLSCQDIFFISAFFLFSLALFMLSLRVKANPGGPVDWNNCVLLCLSLFLLVVTGFVHCKLVINHLNQQENFLSALSESGGEHVFTGFVLDAPVPVKEGCRSRVMVQTMEEPGRSSRVMEKLAVTFRGTSWQYLGPGDSIRFSAHIRKVRNFKTPGAFDYENWWALRGIKIKGYCNSQLRLAVLKDHGREFSSSIHIGIQKIRHKIMKDIDAFFRDQDSRAVAMALLTGEKAWFGPKFREVFSMLGLGHLLAVSGLHMALVALFTGGFVRFLLGRSEWVLLHLDVRMISCMAAVAACFFYAALAGFSPSSLRAFIMVAVIGISLFIRRPYTLLNSLALAALILLVLSPFYLFDISFQLSFFVVFFLIQYAPFLTRPGKYFGRRIVELSLLSIASFIFASPLVAFYFHRFALLAIPLNIIAVPLTEFLILPWLLTGLVHSVMFNFLPNIFWSFSLLFMSLLKDLVTGCAAIPGVNSHVLPPSIAQVCLITAFFMVLPAARISKKARSLVFVVIGAFFFLLAQGIYHRRYSDELVLHVPDVGQGLCQVVEFPYGKVMVTDVPGSQGFDVGRMVVAPFLRRLGISRIDVLAVSHPEMDHMAGIPSILKEFEVRQLWMPTYDNPGLAAWSETMELANKKNIPVKRRNRISKVSMGPGATVTVIPCRKCPDSMSRNARCLVFSLEYKSKTILLTGDIDKWREKRLARSLDISSQILMVPHHGSRTSSSISFLKAVSPHIAICSVGYKNVFHLPSRLVMKRYESLGIPVLRTDKDGTITVKIQGNGTGLVRTYSGQDIRRF